MIMHLACLNTTQPQLQQRNETNQNHISRVGLRSQPSHTILHHQIRRTETFLTKGVYIYGSGVWYLIMHPEVSGIGFDCKAIDVDLIPYLQKYEFDVSQCVCVRVDTTEQEKGR